MWMAMQTEDGEADEEGEEEEQEEEKAPEIKVETTPNDRRFVTTNQARHCYTRYQEYHRCAAEKGEDSPDCSFFQRAYRSICPSEWVEKYALGRITMETCPPCCMQSLQRGLEALPS